jgi:hypothetical protein
VTDRPDALKVSREQWEWFGNAGHFICARNCQFHLTTKVGRFLVSTVGEYMPEESVREILARSRGITLVGRGDERLASYQSQLGFEEIGYGRTYETMVFAIGDETCPCGCGLPVPVDYSELTAEGYRDAKTATQGHYAPCERAALGNPEEQSS